MAQTDLTTAYNYAQGLPAGITKNGDIGGQTLVPGVYTASTSLGITGNLYLNGPGVYIFQIGSTLTTASGSAVVLEGGATADNVFWAVGSSATLGTTSVFNGNILAMDSITENTGAVLTGRALARTGAVTCAGNTDTAPGQGGGGTPPTLTPAPSSLILVAIGLACILLYTSRKRIFAAVGRN